MNRKYERKNAYKRKAMNVKSIGKPLTDDKTTTRPKKMTLDLI